MNDTDGEFKSKTTTAKKDIEHMMEKYNEEYNGIQNERYRMMVHEQSTAFFKAVCTFHPLIFHLKARNFKEYKGGIKFYTCPFGKKAKLWCRNHGLGFIACGKIACECDNHHKPIQLHTLKLHILDMEEKQNYMWHSALIEYLKYCEEWLPFKSTWTFGRPDQDSGPWPTCKITATATIGLKIDLQDLPKDIPDDNQNVPDIITVGNSSTTPMSLDDKSEDI